MPSFAVRRNCSATISSGPLQAVALKASPTRDDRVGLVVLLQLQLGNDSLRALSSPLPAVTWSAPSFRAPCRTCRRACTRSLGTRICEGRHGGPARRPSPRTSRMSLLDFVHFSPRWKATKPPLFALGAATLSVASVIEIVAATFERRNMRQCSPGASTCRL